MHNTLPIFSIPSCHKMLAGLVVSLPPRHEDGGGRAQAPNTHRIPFLSLSMAFLFFQLRAAEPSGCGSGESDKEEILLKKWVRERVLRCSTPSSHILPCLHAIISCCVCSRLCLRNSIEKSSDKALLSTRTRQCLIFFPFLHISSSTCSSGFIDVQCGLPQVNDDPKSRTCECRRRIR